ncbi:MAG: MFS transporter [Candidatus Tectomicrobia bacterium]|nr:MFS transporter [Candidatus Tectomicrobia bacterium]
MRRWLIFRLSAEQWAWMLYDFANTSFSVIIVTFVYAVYFRQIVVGGATNFGDLLWGVNGAISMLLVACLAPLLGAWSDAAAARKRGLLAFSALCIAGTALLARIGPGMVFAGMVLFISANIAFEMGSVFYNAFLPQIAPPHLLHTLSGYGWALGYAGAVGVILLARPLLAGGLAPENLANVRLSFFLTALFFALFTLPAALWLRERRERVDANPLPLFRAFKVGYRRWRQTLREVRRHRRAARFLVAYCCYNEGITTVIYFSSIYASHTLGMSMDQLILFYLSVQTSGIVGAILFGWVGDWLGSKRTLTLTLVLWVVVILGAFAARSRALFSVVGLLAGLAIGSSQSTSRAMMASLLPAPQGAEFFGFYGVSGRLSAAVGPLVFGLVSSWTGSQRLAILSVLAFFVAGLILVQGVPERDDAPG